MASATTDELPVKKRRLGESNSDEKVVTDSDFTDVVNQLTPSDLKHLYDELSNLSVQDVEKRELEAGTDVNLQGKSVLRSWRKINGKEATRKALLDALDKCKLKRAIEELTKKWARGECDIESSVLEEEPSSPEAATVSPHGLLGGTDRISDNAFTDVIQHLEADQLEHFYNALPGITHAEVTKAKAAANTHDVDLQAMAVLRRWRENNGRLVANKDVILETLQKCRFLDKKEKLSSRWNLHHLQSGSNSQDGLIKWLVKDLKKYYLQDLCRKPIYPWNPNSFVDLESIYVPVTMDIELHGARSIKQRVESYEDLFKADEECTRYLLSGSPGQGKSCFSAKLAYDWCKGTAFANIKLLFIVQLGSVNHRSNIEDEISSQLLSSDVCIDKETLGKVIHNLGKSVLLVLDGFDEASPNLMNRKRIGNLVKIIRYGQLRDCRVIVTTRPWREREIAQFSAYTRLELQRMSRVDAKQFVEKFFGQNKDDYMTVALGKHLLKFIDENKLLVDTSTPLMVLLICWYWTETNGNKGIPERIGDLYEKIVNIMYGKLRRPYTAKKELLDQLGKTALEGVTPVTTKLVFTEEDFQKSYGEQRMAQALDMGLICRKGKKFLQFFHKSGQEFCAGMYLANHLEILASYLQDITTINHSLSVGLVLKFASKSKTAGEMIVEKLMTVFKTEIEGDDEESSDPDSSDSEFDSGSIPVTSIIQKYYRERLPLDKTLPIQQFIELYLECCYASIGDNKLCTVLQHLFPYGRVLLYGIPSKTAVALAYFMEHCDSEAITWITLRPVAHATGSFVEYGPTNDMYEATLQSLSYVPEEKLKQVHDKYKAANPNLHETLTLDSPASLVAYIACIQACEGLPKESETSIAPVINSLKHVDVQYLDFNNFQLGDTFDCLLDALENGYLRTVDELLITSSTSRENQMTRLASQLHKMPVLGTLYMSNNKVEDGKTLPNLARNFKECKELKRLALSDMKATFADTMILAENIPPQLRLLDIDFNMLNDPIAARFANTLTRTLTHLIITVANLSVPQHDALLSSIQDRLTSLQRLDLLLSDHSEDLVKHGGLILKSCAQLEYMTLESLEYDPIQRESAEIFLDGLNHSTKLETLILMGIVLEENGFRRLVEIAKIKCLDELSYHRAHLPKGIDAEDLDDFVTLM